MYGRDAVTFLIGFTLVDSPDALERSCHNSTKCVRLWRSLNSLISPGETALNAGHDRSSFIYNTRLHWSGGLMQRIVVHVDSRSSFARLIQP